MTLLEKISLIELMAAGGKVSWKTNQQLEPTRFGIWNSVGGNEKSICPKCEGRTAGGRVFIHRVQLGSRPQMQLRSFGQADFVLFRRPQTQGRSGIPVTTNSAIDELPYLILIAPNVRTSVIILSTLGLSSNHAHG